MRRCTERIVIWVVCRIGDTNLWCLVHGNLCLPVKFRMHTSHRCPRASRQLEWRRYRLHRRRGYAVLLGHRHLLVHLLLHLLVHLLLHVHVHLLLWQVRGHVRLMHLLLLCHVLLHVLLLNMHLVVVRHVLLHHLLRHLLLSQLQHKVVDIHCVLADTLRPDNGRICVNGIGVVQLLVV